MEQFEDIYRQFHSKVLSYVLSRVRPPEEAEDVCSAIFEKVLRGLDDYDADKGAVSTWVYRIAHNTVLDHLKARRPTAELDDGLASEERIDDDLLRGESLSALAAALERLDDEERDVIVLRFYEGCTLREVSERMGMPYRTVVRREKAALARLRFLLKPYF